MTFNSVNNFIYQYLFNASIIINNIKQLSVVRSSRKSIWNLYATQYLIQSHNLWIVYKRIHFDFAQKKSQTNRILKYKIKHGMIDLCVVCSVCALKTECIRASSIYWTIIGSNWSLVGLLSEHYISAVVVC